MKNVLKNANGKESVLKRKQMRVPLAYHFCHFSLSAIYSKQI